MTDRIRASSPREFAIRVVEHLRSAGFQALWAGGCVRDQLLGLEPQDYDVATNATPPDICRVFRRHRTLTIGAAFGVVAVVGSRHTGTVEVATFRRDETYSDGRHPDAVTYSSAEEDARRRDFTINGLFYDPNADRVIDYVGGQQDLQAGVIRAIGDPVARFGEDKLRMLRAVRFTAHFRFRLDEQTKAAILACPQSVLAVSAERIAEEMRKMLIDPQRAAAVALLRETGLLTSILPEATHFTLTQGRAAWAETLQVLERLKSPPFPVAMAALVRRLLPPLEPIQSGFNRIARRWKLSNEETDFATWLLENEQAIRSADHAPWPPLQRVLISEGIDHLIQLAEAIAEVAGGHLEPIDYCRRKLAMPREQLNPAPLITGTDLIDHGIPPGRQYRLLLSAVRDAQLEQRISTKEQALQLVDQLRRSDR